MDTRILQTLHVHQRPAVRRPRDAGPGNPVHRRADDSAPSPAVGGQSANLRSRLDALNAACATHEPVGKGAESGDRGQAGSRYRLELILAARARAIAGRLDDTAARHVITALEDEDLSLAFQAHLDALREVDKSLLRIDRSQTEARGDLPLEEFWRGVERDYREEAHRLALWIGAAAIRLARSDPRSDDAATFARDRDGRRPSTTRGRSPAWPTRPAST